LTATANPSAAKRRVMAAPMPRDAPVTMATWLFLIVFMIRSFVE
jgi:hypothetical protein